MNLNVRRNWMALLFSAGLTLSLAGCDGFEGRKDTYYAKGQELFEAGDDARARLEFKNALQIDSKHAPSWFLLGRIEERAKEYRKAFQNYARAIEFDPKFMEPRVRKAQLLVAANQLDLAKDEIDVVLGYEPENVGALIARGALRQRSDDIPGAEADVRAVLAKEPNNGVAAALLSRIQADRKEVGQATETLRKAIAANPDDVALQLMLGELHDAEGDVESALEVLKALVEQNPETHAYRLRLASYYENLKRLDEAEGVLREALNQSPEDLQRQRALLQFLVRARGAEEGMTELAQMIESQPDALELRFMKAELQRAAGDLEGLEGNLRGVIEKTEGAGPDAIRAQTALARLLAENGRAQEAAPLIETVLQQSAAEPDALQLRAMLALRGGEDVERAIADLRLVLRDHPDRVGAYRLLGLAHVQREEYSLAQDALKRAVELAPEEPIVYLQLAEVRNRMGDNEGAVTVLEQLLTRDPGNVAAQDALARFQLAGQDWESMSETAERIKNTRPEHPLGPYLQGLTLQHNGEHRQAIEQFGEALALNSKAVEPLVGIARSHLALKEPQEALRRVNEVLGENPENLVAMNLLGEIQVTTGDLEQAAQTFQAAMESHPKSPRAYIRMSQLQIAQNDLSGARQTLERGVEQTDRNGYLVLQLGVLLDQLGEMEEAIHQYEDMLKRFPDALVAANNLAVLLTRQPAGPERLDRALELASRLKDSEVPEFIDTLGWVHYQRGEYDAALPYLEKAVAGRSASAELRYHLGMAYAKLDRADEAREHLAFAAAVDGFVDKSAAQEALGSLGGG